MATIVSLTHSLPPKPQSKARVPKLADWLFEKCPSQIGPIYGPLACAQDRALKLYDKRLARKFPNPTLVEASASKITEPFSKAPSSQVQSSSSKMDIDPPSVTNTSILGELANADNVVFLESPEDWGLNNQISGCDLYVHSPTVFYHSLTILAQSLTICANVIAATRNFVASSSVVCMARCNNKFVLPTLPIAENLQRYDRVLCTACKGKEAPHGCSYNDKWFLDSGTSVHFTPFEFDFISMTQGNYGHIETANSKAPLFMVAVGTVLIEHEIIDPKNKTTRTAISKLWPVYCIPGMTICFLSTGQLLQSKLSIESTMDGSTFCDLSGDTVLSALPNLWESTQVVRTCIIKNNVSNPISLVTRHPDYETIHHCLGHISDEAMKHVSDNVEGTEKICFPNKKHVYCGCALGKLHQHSFSENPKCSSETLGLIHSDLLELPTLSYSKYKWVIIFLDNYSSYCRVVFLHKKTDAAEAIKAVFRL